MIKFSLFGIKIKINLLLIPVLIYSIYFNYYREFLITLMVVLIHEIAHYKMGEYYGINLREIELFPFGGVVKVENELGVDPIKEMAIAIAGPLSNLILFISGYFLGLYLPIKEDLLYIFLAANFMIGLFNLVPIIPLDGGRIFRAFLSYIWGMKKATSISVFIGKLLSIMMFLVGVYYTKQSLEHIYLMFLAAFLYFNVHRERKMVFFLFIKDVLRKKRTLQNKGVMNAKYLTVMETVDLNRVFQEFSTGRYHFVTVISGKGEILGTLTEGQILDAVGHFGNEMSIGELLRIKIGKSEDF